MTTADVRDARRIFIVGAGGFGREVLAWARDAWPEATAKVLGFRNVVAFVLHER